MNSRSTFYHPILELQDEKIPFGAFWEKRVKKFQELIAILKQKYDTYLCSKGNPRLTVDSMGIKPGDTLWIQIFAYSERLAYLSSLLPRFKAAKIVGVLGKSSLMLEDQETGRKITRHLTDVYPIKPTGNFSNLFQGPKEAIQQDVEEDFGGMKPSEIPEVCLDGNDVDQLKQDESKRLAEDSVSSKDVVPTPSDQSKPDDETPVKEREVQKWVTRLRHRGQKVNYKD